MLYTVASSRLSSYARVEASSMHPLCRGQQLCYALCRRQQYAMLYAGASSHALHHAVPAGMLCTMQYAVAVAMLLAVV